MTVTKVCCDFENRDWNLFVQQ